MDAIKIVHRNENRIKVDFPYNNNISVALKKIPDAQWSGQNANNIKTDFITFLYTQIAVFLI